MARTKIYEMDNAFVVFKSDGSLSFAISEDILRRPVIRKCKPFKGKKLYCITFTKTEVNDMLSMLSMRNKVK